MDRQGEAKVSFLRGRLPRAYAWVRTKDGKSQRVTILFDSGASHCFMSPRIQAALGLQADMSAGPASLLTSNEQSVPCQGEVSGLQVLAHKYKHRMDFVVADIGRDDIILGGEILEMQQAGFGAPGSGTYRMVKDGVEFLIPLIGEHGISGEVKRIKGTKKALKLLRQHADHIFMGKVWRKTEAHPSAEVQSSDIPQAASTREQPESAKTDSKSASTKEGRLDDQERDAQRCKDATYEATSSASTSKLRSTSSRRRKYESRRRKAQEAIERMREQQTELQAESDRIKADLIQEFPDVFQEPDRLPPLRWENHRMELLPDSRLPQARGLPRMSKEELDETNRWLQDMLSKGLIRPSLAPYASRFFFVPKPNGKGLRGVCDFRAINAITKKILPSLPLFENVVTQLDGAKFFSALDLTSMFYQIRVEPKDVENTAFRTAVGVYEYLVTPMGTTPSVGTAMNMMQQVLQHVISLPGEKTPPNPRIKPPFPPQEDYPDDGSWKSLEYHSALGAYCCVFIDDLLIYSKTMEDHVRHLRQLCATFRQHKLFLNPDKCNICRVEVEYLGNMIGREGIRPTEERTQALADWPTPENASELKSFLGLLGFIRRYIPDLAQIAVPLNSLLKKDVGWHWGPAQQQAFDKLKRRCLSTPVLAIPSGQAELVLRTDASREAMGVALYQKDQYDYLQPVEFKSKAFAESQKRLAAHDREGLALLFGLKSFRHFLLGREFTVQTDNAALSQILTSRDMSDLYSRWYYKIAEFGGMKIAHRAGRKLYCADALSRRRVNENEDLAPFFVEPGELFRTMARPAGSSSLQDELEPQSDQSQLHIQLVRDESRQFTLKVSSATEHSQATTIIDPDRLCASSSAFHKCQLESAFLQQAKHEWPDKYQRDPDLSEFWVSKEATGGSVRWGYFKIDGLLYKEGPVGPRLCVPLGADKVEILRQVHDAPSAGHGGKHRTLARALGEFYWPGMYGDVVKYVETCHTCQLAKGDRRAQMGDARALDIPKQPWDVVHMDWITGFERSPEGYDAILVFVDSLTGMVHLQPCRKTDTSRDTANHFVHNIVRLHGMPTSLVSDRDVRLRANFWRALQQKLGTELRFTTAYAPNSNGKVERVNMVLGDVLRSLCSFSGKDWAQHLDLAEFAINGSQTNATGLTPFFANYAREMRAPAALGRPTLEVPAAEEFVDAMLATVTHTRDALERAKRKYERQITGKRRKAEAFQAGDKVLLSTRNLDIGIATRKLTSKFVGPFEVLPAPARASNPNVVWLRTPRTLKLHMPINIKNIRRYKERPPELGGPNNVVPEPIIVNGQEQHEVDEILAEKEVERKGKIHRKVLVKWVGLDVLEATWEPLANMPLGVVQEWRRLQGKLETEDLSLEESDSSAAEETSPPEEVADRSNTARTSQKGKVKWVHIPSYPWWPSMEVSLSKVPPQLRQNVAEAERPGTTLMYTFGDGMYYWAKPKAMKEWRGPEHASMVKAGKGKLFKQAVAEGEEEWAK